MKSRYGYMDPGAIMGVVVSLIILSVGVFAFFVTMNSIPGSTTVPSATTTLAQNTTYAAIQNVTGTGTQVFNIVGIVLVIGAIMTIVGLVYNYVR